MTHPPFKLVILESPYASDTAEGLEENLRYARACMRDCLLRKESPLASHLLYTQAGILDDNIPSERSLGIYAGLAWHAHSDFTVVYTDRGISRGMQLGIDFAKEQGKSVEFRKLPNYP